MTKEEYIGRVEFIKKQATLQIKAAGKELALSNNPFKIGGLVTDHIGTICIESISIYHYGTTPKCKYVGTEYTRKGTPRKDNRKREVYQQNVIQETP